MRGQKSEDRCQKTEDRGQVTEDRQKVGSREGEKVGGSRMQNAAFGKLRRVKGGKKEVERVRGFSKSGYHRGK